MVEVQDNKSLCDLE